MEEYDQEFLTFTVKDEPDSEDEFNGFEVLEDTSEYASVYKKFVIQPTKEKKNETEMHEETLDECMNDASDQMYSEYQDVVIVENIKEKQNDKEEQKDDFTQHKKESSDEIQTELQTSLVDIRNMKSEDVGQVVKVYVCDVCGTKYTRKSKLRTHLLNHVVKGPNDLPICQYCGEVFDSIDKFFEHFEQTHDTNAEDVLITFKEVNQVLCCEYCGNAYDYPDALNKHRSIHSGNAKPYLCQYCDNQFDAYSKLVTHSLKHNDLKTEYPVDRYWLCDFEGCTKALKNITSLNYHKKNVHQKKYMSQCKECTEVFENSWSLHNHVQVKHLGPFPCSVCERSCPTTKLLKRHMLTHNKIETDQTNTTRRFVNYCKYLKVDNSGSITCKDCQQTFDTRKRFRTHVVEFHDNTKNFFCDQCDKGFTLAWQLNSHVEGTHTKKFQCTVCGAYKNKQSKLLQHMKIHQFPCHCCDKSFSRQQYLDNHIKKRHVSKLICGNFEQKVLNKCEYVDSNGVRRPQPTKIYVMPGPCSDGLAGSQTPIRTINVNIDHDNIFTEPKIRKRHVTSSVTRQYKADDINDQQNLENLAAIAFLESEMSQAAKLLTMPFINK